MHARMDPRRLSYMYPRDACRVHRYRPPVLRTARGHAAASLRGRRRGDRMLLGFWAAAAAVAVGLPGASASEGWQSSVVTLTEGNFERTVKAAEVLLVEFYGTARRPPAALTPEAQL